MVAEAKELRRRLLPKQMQFVRTPGPASDRGRKWHVMYSGSVGAGKSHSLGVDILAHCAGRPNTRYGLFRQTSVALVRSTLKTMLEGDGDTPPVFPYGSFDHNQSKREIRLKGGGEVVYSGLDDPVKVRSMNLSRAGIDELIECDEDGYLTVSDRVRMVIDGEPLAVKSATNPGSPAHWAARRWGIAAGVDPMPGHVLIKTRTTDNSFLPPEYVADLLTHTGAYYRRMVLGEWCGMDGTVYEGRWDRDRHVRAKPQGPCQAVYGGIDYGDASPTSIHRYEVDHDGAVHVRSEVYQPRLGVSGIVATVQELLGDATEIVYDSAAEFLGQLLRERGMPAVPSVKGPDSVLDGIQQVSSMLAAGTLTVEPECQHMIAEFETWRWAENQHGLKDRPVDADNHAMDELRYVVRRIKGSNAPLLSVVGAGSTRADDPVESVSFSDLRADPEWGWN